MRLDDAAYALELTVARRARGLLLDGKPPENTGVMVALFPSDPDRLTVKGGESADQIHLTLAFLGTVGQVDQEALVAAVESWALVTPILTGTVSGTGTFLEGSKPVSYWSADVPRLPEHREALIKTLEAADLSPKKDHGFTPHITADYAKRKLVMPENNKLRFGSVVVAYGDERTVIPFRGRVNDGL
jgi:hypothetical protein